MARPDPRKDYETLHVSSRVRGHPDNIRPGRHCECRPSRGRGDKPAIPLGNDLPGQVAVDPTTHLAFVTEINDDLLAVIDGADNPPQVVHTIHLGDPATFNNGGADPDAVGVDPTTHTVYVANGNGTVQVINGYEIIAGLRLGSYPGSYSDGVVVDPTSHTAYVTEVSPTPSRCSASPRTRRPSPALFRWGTFLWA